MYWRVIRILRICDDCSNFKASWGMLDFRFPLSLFRYLSFLRNYIRWMLFYYFMYVERDYEEDHDGGYTDTSEDG